MTDEKDLSSKEMRCPRLGGPVQLSYCEVESSGKPCLKMISCWSPQFDVTTMLAEKMGPENMEAYFSKQVKPKVITLIELIEQARKTLKDTSKES